MGHHGLEHDAPPPMKTWAQLRGPRSSNIWLLPPGRFGSEQLAGGYRDAGLLEIPIARI